MPEDHTAIWIAMGDLMMKLISQKSVLDTIDADELMKEAGEAHLLPTSIKTSADN